MADYGGMFRDWLFDETPKPYNSFGNGSAMRVSPVGCAFDTLEETLATLLLDNSEYTNGYLDSQ